jgi:hypothetical protein
MPIIHRSGSANRTRVVVSLCDFSGQWPRPYIEAGYTVIQFDLKHGDDCNDVPGTLEAIDDAIAMVAVDTGTNFGDFKVVGILAAPLCTTFTNSGARWWPRHEQDGTRAMGVRLAESCLAIIEARKPDWWALENPAGRLPKLVPAVGKAWYFHPSDYAGWLSDPAEREANRYTKKTGIWGTAVKPPTMPLDPIMYERKRADGTTVRGSWMWANLGGKSERTKALRSNTPMGFARAFATVNR